MDDIAAADDATLTPLAVDLDGTLVRSDTLHEGVIRAIKARPLVLFSLCAALRHGKAAFKRAAAAAAPFDAAAAPYNHAVLDFLRAERRAGRTLGLFTAADQSIADEVAAHLGLFAVARGSDGVTNLSGAAKADAIAATFGPSFAYAGDDAVDRPIFARARGVVLVGAVERLKATLADGAIVEASFPAPPARFATWMRALRLQHCVKNFLVFAPVILSAWTLPILLRGALLFLLLGALASATYLINDLFDLGSDRQHPHKRRRPLASGDISVRSGAVVACLMIPAALLCSLALPVLCSASLLAYLAVTLAYSLVLKQIPMVDVTVLAGLFTLRVLAGSLLLPTAVSPWLLTFSLLFFFGLAVIKRYAELDRLAQGRAGPAQARGIPRGTCRSC